MKEDPLREKEKKEKKNNEDKKKVFIRLSVYLQTKHYN